MSLKWTVVFMLRGLVIFHWIVVSWHKHEIPHCNGNVSHRNETTTEKFNFCFITVNSAVSIVTAKLEVHLLLHWFNPAATMSFAAAATNIITMNMLLRFFPSSQLYRRFPFFHRVVSAVHFFAHSCIRRWILYIYFPSTLIFLIFFRQNILRVSYRESICDVHGKLVSVEGCAMWCDVFVCRRGSKGKTRWRLQSWHTCNDGKKRDCS